MIKVCRRLLDEQLENLKKCGCPSYIIDEIKNRSGTIVSTAANITKKMPESDNLPLLPVINFEKLPLEIQMLMCSSGNGSPVATAINHSERRTANDGIYFLFDVNLGSAFRNVPPVQAAKNLLAEHRTPINDLEAALALCRHSDVLDKHNIYIFKPQAKKLLCVCRDSRVGITCNTIDPTQIYANFGLPSHSRKMHFD